MKFFIFLFTFAAFNLFSLGNREKIGDSPSANVETSGADMKNTIKITGRIMIYGNEPHTSVGIVDEKGTEYAISPASREEELRTLQGHLIEFTVFFPDESVCNDDLCLLGGTVTPVEWRIIR